MDTPTTLPTPASPMPSAPAFKSFSALLSGGWAHFRARLNTFLIIAVIAGLLGLVGALSGVLAILAGIVQFFLGLVVLFLVVWDVQPVGRLVRQAGPRILPFLLISVFAGLAIWGGTLLLVIPGIVVGVYLSFSTYVFAAEGLTGRAALKQSHAYVLGSWWDVFWRTFGIGLVGFVASGILGVVVWALGDSAVGNGLSTFISSLVGGWAACAMYRLYLNARERRVGQALPTPTGFFANYNVLAIIGLLGAIAIPILLAVASFATWSSDANLPGLY